MAYASKSLSGAEKRYACIGRELLAIAFGTQRFHTCLHGRKFRVITDHLPLVAIVQKGLINSPPRLQRMLLKLQGYDMEVEYQPGKEIVLADTLSRLPSVHNKETIDLDVRVDFVRFSDERIQELRNKTKDDQVLRTHSEPIVTGWHKTIKELPTSIRSYWAFRDELSVEDGILLMEHELSSLRACSHSYWTGCTTVISALRRLDSERKTPCTGSTSIVTSRPQSNNVASAKNTNQRNSMKRSCRMKYQADLGKWLVQTCSSPMAQTGSSLRTTTRNVRLFAKCRGHV